MQFHIDVEEQASRTPGPVRLQLPNLQTVQQQLQQCTAQFADTKFEVKVASDSKHISVTDPGGQIFEISEADTKNDVTGPRIDSLVFPCHEGTAAAIAQFYKDLLQVALGLPHAVTCICS